jgi:hypothetical protein
MRTKTFLLALLFSILACNISFAQNSPEDIVNKFFDLYKKDSIDKAIDYIFATNKYSGNSQDAIDQLKISLKKTIEVDGPFWGHELITQKMAGERFIMLTFLVRHDRDPLTFRIVFYKPNDKWQVQNFKFDNKMDDELEEASKRY